VIRITWRQLHEEPHLVETDLRLLLAQPAPSLTREPSDPRPR
jgi:hypothetical protein